MNALSNAEFLTMLESGHRLHPLDKGLLAIAASFPNAIAESVADWSLGRRNSALAQLRAFYFGPLLQGWTKCGQCGEKLEFEIDCRTLVKRQEQASGELVEVGGRRFRVPTSRDLARLVREPDERLAAVRLAQDCLLDGGDGQLSGESLEEIGEKMAQADPLAEVLLRFDCPMCQYSSQELLDLPSFLWSELEARGRRLLMEVHTLARAYGWGEAEILGMSEYRRTAYLQMVQG